VAAQGEEHLRKLTVMLKTRDLEIEKMQADLKQAEAAKEALSADLQKLRQALDAVMAEKRSVEDRVKQQLDETAAKMRQSVAHQLGNEIQNWPFPRKQGENTAAPESGLLRGHAAHQAEEAASKLDETTPGQDAGPANDVDQGWKMLMDRAAVMLEQTHRNEERAATYLPKLESALTQLRKAGRYDEADRLQAEANSLLGVRPSPGGKRDESRPETTPRDARHPRAWGDVERAVEELRREVGQLRGEVRELRKLLEHGAIGNESSHRERKDDPREQSNARPRTANLVSVSSRFAGEVLRVGGTARSIRVGDRVKKGETLALLSSEGLAELLGKLADARKRVELDLRVYKQLEAAGSEAAPERQLLEAKRAVDEDAIAVKELTRAIRLSPLSEEAVSQRLSSLEEDKIEGPATTLGEFELAAPVDGRIVERNLSVGDVVNQGAVLFRVERDASE
jgi:biotin carboxyl carrier protein